MPFINPPKRQLPHDCFTLHMSWTRSLKCPLAFSIAFLELYPNALCLSLQISFHSTFHIVQNHLGSSNCIAFGYLPDFWIYMPSSSAHKLAHGLSNSNKKLTCPKIMPSSACIHSKKSTIIISHSPALTFLSSLV
jgi:hypothetical protein